jgi:transposase
VIHRAPSNYERQCQWDIEEAFKTLKGDLAIRPIFHHDESRIEAHIFVAFLAYCMQITLTRRLAPGLTARSALEKFAAVRPTRRERADNCVLSELSS